MKFPAINSLLTDQLIKALCNTLVHSLWQGIILAAVAGLIIIGTKRASSALRYNLLIAALVLFAAGTVVTFVTQFHLPVYADTNQQAGAIHQSPIIIQPFSGHVVIQSGTLADIISRYLNAYHNPIVLIWFLIICAKSIQLGVGLYGTYQLKRLNVIGVKGFWDERMKQLACLLGIEQGISLLESGLAKVPMVIGHLKPVILIPFGLLASLSAEEAEAILIHELAHIKRRDYLVNMLQSLMEIVFFFNPAVLWISQLIKTERENCCDDMALEQSSNKVSYIRALVSCEEYQAAVPAYAMAFPGSKGTLLDRVKRLASNRNHSLNLFEKTLLAICLVLSGLCVSAFAAKDHIKHTVHEMVKVFQHTLINKEQQDKLAEQNALLAKQTAMIRENTSLLQVRSAGLEIENDTIKKLRQINVNINPVTLSVPVTVIHTDPVIVQVPNVKVQLDPLNVQLSNVKVHLDPLNISLGKVDTNKKVKVKVKVKVSDSTNTAYSNTYSNSYPSGYSLSTHSNSNSNNSYSYSGTRPTAPTPPTPPSVAPKPHRYNSQSQDVNRANEKLITDDLLKDGLIPNTDNFNFTLNSKEFILNGKKQSDAVFEKYKKKYFPADGDSNWTWTHSHSNN